MKKIASTFFVLILSLALLAQPPDYYSAIDFDQDGTSIRVQLSDLVINTHDTFIPYTSSSTDTWDIIRVSDLEFENSSNVLLIYGHNDIDGIFISDRTRNKFNTCHTSSCIGLWNREHVFARSLASPNLTTNEPGPGTDVHNLRAADSQKNTQRSNRLFTSGSGDSSYTIGDYFYPGDEWKGDVARIIMYMYIRYPGQCEATNSGAGSITYAPENDMPDLFLEWNQEDPVSDLEITRNNVIQSYQGNRNPFIDNPHLATLIWGGPVAEETWGLLSSDLQEENFKVKLNQYNGYLQIEGLSSLEFNVKIYNLLGQSLIKINNKTKINISKLNSGIYVAQIEQKEQRNSIKFVVY